MEDIEITDVIICGCGPTGAMLSILLGQQGVSNIVLERDLEVNTDPRGIALDEDGIRYLQACGIYDKIFTEIGHVPERMEFIGGVHQDLHRKPFLALDYSTTEGGTGHPGMMCHKQPAIERNLRAQLEKLPSSSLRVGSTLTSIREDSSWVYVTYENNSPSSFSSSSSSPSTTTTSPHHGNSNNTHHIRAKFLVGADGKTGFVRKNYLEPLGGVTMDHSTGIASYNETWVALNWHIPSLPTPETHGGNSFSLEPLWSRGFSPEEVYDFFFPPNFRFLRNPKRPAVCGRFGLPEDRLWRFEFVVLPEEEEEEETKDMMCGDDKIFGEVVGPYLRREIASQEGGETQVVEFPRDCIEVLRCRPYRFAARSCNRWSLGRTVLCGDAAHVFPPFGGQGIASGFRDAVSVGWRLGLAVSREKEKMGMGTVDYHEKLLEGWYAERKQQLDKSLALTVANGNQVKAGMGTSGLAEMGREWYWWAVQLVPSWRRKIEQGDRRHGMTQYEWEDGRGMAFMAPSSYSSSWTGGGDGVGTGGMVAGGKNFPQVYCRELLRVASPSGGNGGVRDDGGGHSSSSSSLGSQAASASASAASNTVGPVKLTDDAIFSGPNKAGDFKIVVLAPTVDQVAELRGKLDGLATASGGMIDERDATFFVGDTTAVLPAYFSNSFANENNRDSKSQPDKKQDDVQGGRIYRLATAQEFASSKLCQGRPYPHFYNENRMSDEVQGMPFVILRPDRFIFTACGSRHQLIEAAEGLRQLRLG